jgi:hypothetical protein
MGELETLNMLLRLIGSSPVNSLDTDHPDAANAKATMSRISKRAQRRGWWFNIEYNVRLEPNSRKEIRLPDTYSSVVLEDKALVQRGSRVYNKQTQTGIFTESVIVSRMTRILEWDDMPDVMQEYCAYFSAAEYVRDELEDPQKEASLKESASASYLDLKKQDLEEGQYNIFTKNRVVQARGGIQPYGRGSLRFAGDPDR